MSSIKYSWIPVVVFILSVSVSCQRGFVDDGVVAGQEILDFQVVLCGNDDVPEVRSILGGESIETKVTDVTLASYDSDGVLVNAMYKDDLSGTVPLYVSGSKENNIYALVNMGDMTRSFPMSESDVSEIVYMLESYGDISSKGIPMCGKLENCVYAKGQTVRIPVERLFAKLNARILHSDLNGAVQTTPYAYNLCNKSIYIRQANRRLCPFSRNGSKAECPDDIMEVSDYNPDLNDRNSYQGSYLPSQMGPGLGYFQDTTIVLYVPENMQGVLLPANTDPMGKVERAISDLDGEAFDDICTYLELNASKPNRGEGYFGDITYRCYLGEDNVSDFSVKRNTCYNLTLNLTDDGFNLDNWKVERGENWSDVRTLYFVDEPYVAYPGTTKNIILHYNRTSNASNVGSAGDASDLNLDFDAAAMAKAGITCEFMGNAKTVGKNGCADYYFRMTTSVGAKTGISFPIKASTKDGRISDVTQVYVSEVGNIMPLWDFQPEYVAQKGGLTVAGVVDDLLPLTANVSDPSVLKCVSKGDDSFVITALRPGTSEIRISNKDASQTLKLKLNISAPRLKVSDLSIALAPDGAVGSLDYQYLTADSEPLLNIDEDAFNEYLAPVVAGCDYISAQSDVSSIDMYVSKLYSSGQLLDVGAYYDIVVSAADCRAAGTHSMKAYIVDPFSGMPSVYEGKIDDYTLFGFDNVPEAVRKYFSKEISSKVDIKYQVPQIQADLSCVSSSFEPLWTDGFSYGNELYGSDYNHSDATSGLGASVRIRQNSVSKNMKHSAGRHELALHVTNRHSGESLSRTIALLDVYVHTAIGASAAYGRLVCSYPMGSLYPASSVAGIYNDIAGLTIYSPTSSEMIYYMDVSMEYLTDVNNVYIFNQMLRGVNSYSNIMNCLDVVAPSVTDGQTSSKLVMMYSVCVAGGQRVGTCDEVYGMRRGIGAVLYRALSMRTRTDALNESQLESLFLGYSSATGALASHAPCYDIHDMNKGSNMTSNKVSKKSPFYFSPVACSQYRDGQGRGYHVIHPLETIVPKSCGWINLL